MQCCHTVRKAVLYVFFLLLNCLKTSYQDIGIGLKGSRESVNSDVTNYVTM